MADDATTRVWLVERSYDDRDLVTLVYATPDGERVFRQERAAATLHRQGDVTAARDVEASRLTPVDDADRRERYATEAARMAERRDPDEAV